MISDMQMAASMGGKRLEIISSLLPVTAIIESVQIIETAIINNGTIMVFTDRNNK